MKQEAVDSIATTNALVSGIVNELNNCKHANDVSTRGKITGMINTVLSRLEKEKIIVDSHVTCNLTNNTKFEDDVLCVDVHFIPVMWADVVHTSFVLDFDADESTPEENFARAMMGV